MPNKIIKLTKPLVGHDGPIHEVVLREPRFEEYRELGDPWLIAQTAEGQPYAVENAEVVRAYESLCLVSPDASIVPQGGLRLAQRIRREVLGFFQPGDEADEASPTSPTTSS